MLKLDVGDFSVQDIYTDSVGVANTTDVYANGHMQACVFVAAEYYGENEDEEAIENFVRNETKIYALTENDKFPVDWQFSPTSNEYIHDINRSTSVFLSAAARRTYYVPFYFTVPRSASGEYRWIAKFNGEFTSPKNYVTVKCHTFFVHEGNFNFLGISNSGRYHLRALRYVNFIQENAVKLVECTDYDEFGKYDVGGTIGVCWRAYLGANGEAFYLLEHETSSASDALELQVSKGLGSAFTPEEVQRAKTAGLAVVSHYPTIGDPNFYVNDLEVEDNCGNKMTIKLDRWSVKEVVLQ